MTRAALLLSLCFSLVPAYAADIAVNSEGDAADVDPSDGICNAAAGGPALCTLRAAVQTANQSAEADAILLPPGSYELRLQGAGENGAATGDLDVTTSLTVQGEAGERNATVVDGARLGDRLFDVHAAGVLALANVTLQYGRTAPGDADPGFPGLVSGGCVRSAGAVTLDRTFLYRCRSRGDGGGLGVIGGSAAVTDTIFSLCRAKGDGGALLVRPGASASVLRAALARGNAARGGAVAASGPLTLASTTLDVNRAKLGGGLALLGDASATLRSVTASSNGAVNLDASGTTGSLAIASSIVWGAGQADCRGAVVSGGGNLEGATSCGFTNPTGDQQNQDPGLAPIGFYSDDPDAIAVRPLVEASPAIDHGNDADCEPTDARGEARVDVADVGLPGVTCDGGAFEFVPPAP